MRLTLNAFFMRWQAKVLWFGLSMVPFAWLVWGATHELLGANPAETLIRATGEWTLRALCLLLLITPLRTAAALPALARMRRMAGLFVYFYALLHLACYAWLDMGLDLTATGADIAKRPFILVGFVAVVLLTPLALTSFNRAIRALGPQRWRALHRVVYVIAILGVLHFFWMRTGKNDFAEVLVYAVIVATLLGWRVRHALKAARSRRATNGPGAPARE